MTPRRSPLVLVLVVFALAASAAADAKPPIHIAFHWHMHQPIYWPYESVVQTADAGRYGFSLMEVHQTRSGPYTAWPADAIRSGRDAGLAHLGAQVSFSGSLVENLDAIAAAGRGFGGWTGAWSEALGWQTALGNRRLDLVKFGYHHPLMPLVDHRDIVRQIRMHGIALERHFGAGAAGSKGIFPPETGFAERVIPAFREAGIEWVIVDNIHFDRARPDYPYTPDSRLVPPNPADQRNTGGDVTWVPLNGIWAPSRVAAPWGYQPHHAAWIDPDTGEETRIVVVPAARYEGNEDARGGFGALQYEAVLSQYEALNTDDDHPMLVVLHHDGDNYGGGTDSYYHSNFGNFIEWLQANPDRFVCTTIQDYLDRYPPAADDVIHVEPGSWSGADNGDAEFQKWNGDPDGSGHSPDRASWAVMTAAQNRVKTAERHQAVTDVAHIVDGDGNDVEQAWHFLLNGQTSCYWYWDGAENGIWDSHPARAANLAVERADRVLAGAGGDDVPPSLYEPQREPYNPGGIEWGTEPQPSDFAVWTFAYDVSGLEGVTLRFRTDADGRVDRANRLREGGGWQSLPMTATATVSHADPAPRYVADTYTAEVAGLHDVLVDYYVEASDARGNVARSPIQHVYVGQVQGGGPGDPDGVHWEPAWPTADRAVTIFAPKAGHLHWGVNGWDAPPETAWPEGTEPWGDGKAVETTLAGPDEEGFWWVALGPFAVEDGIETIEFVIRNVDGSWDNNGGADYHLTLHDDPPPPPVDAGGGPGVDAAGPGPDVRRDAGGSGAGAETVAPGLDVSGGGGGDDGGGGGGGGGGGDNGSSGVVVEPAGPGDSTQPGGCQATPRAGDRAPLVWLLLWLLLLPALLRSARHLRGRAPAWSFAISPTAARPARPLRRRARDFRHDVRRVRLCRKSRTLLASPRAERVLATAPWRNSRLA